MAKKKTAHSGYKLLSMLLVLCTILGVGSSITGIVKGAGSDVVPGELVLDKTAAPHKTEANQWDITLTLRGLDLISSSDVVLVIDSSGSMQDDSKLVNTKIAAKAFVENLVGENSSAHNNVNIALVTFSGEAVTLSNLTDNAASLYAAIDNIWAEGATHIQAGIRLANDILAASRATNKYIVLLGDGEPTYSYRVDEGGRLEAACTEIGDRTTATWEFSDDFSMKINYGKTAGHGGGYYLPSSDRIQPLKCPVREHGMHYFPDNNGIATIYEAKLTKEQGIEIYTVALNTGDDGKAVLASCSSGDSYTYVMENSDAASLKAAYEEMASKISYAATNSVVTDPIGPMFDFVEGSINVSHGDANYNERVISWDIGDIVEAEGYYTMTYTVEIKPEAKDGVLYPTNGRTYVDYIDADGRTAQKDFPIPEVAIPKRGTITVIIYVLEDGVPLNAQGFEAKDVGEIEYLTRSYYRNPQTGANILEYGTYSVTASATITHDGSIYKYVEGNAANLGDVSPVDVKISEDNESPRVYFAYEYVGPDKPPVTSPYTVTFIRNYEVTDSTIISEVTVKGGETVGGKMPKDPTRDGYVFKGWNIERDGTGQTFTGETVVNDDVEVYALWEKIATDYTYQIDAVYTRYLDGTVAGTNTVTGAVVQGEKDQIVTADTDDYAVYNSKTYTFVDGKTTLTLAEPGHYVLTLYYELRETTPPVTEPEGIILYLNKVLHDENGNEIGTGISFWAQVLDSDGNEVATVQVEANGAVKRITGLKSGERYYLREMQGENFTLSGYQAGNGQLVDKEYIIFRSTLSSTEVSGNVYITISNVAKADEVDIIDPGVPQDEWPEIDYNDEEIVDITPEEIPLTNVPVPPTGDDGRMMLYLAVAAISFLGIIALVPRKLII